MGKSTQKVAGVTYIRADGDMYTVAGTCNVRFQATAREGIENASGEVLYSEKPLIDFIEFEHVASTDIDLEKLHNITNATVQIESGDRVGVLRSAYFAGESDFDVLEGKRTVRFEGRGEWL